MSSLSQYHVTCRPLPSHTIDEVVKRLEEVGATEIHLVAELYVSALIHEDDEAKLDDLASVQRKVEKRLSVDT